MSMGGIIAEGKNVFLTEIGDWEVGLVVGPYAA
jgi:hypothetical protein